MIVTCPSCGRANRVPAPRLNGRAHCGSCKGGLVPLAHPVEMTDPSELDELMRGSPLPLVVDFWAPWCGPCRIIAPELKTIASRYAGRAVVAKVNTDELPDLGERFRIRGIPTLIRFDGGTETTRVSGAQGADALARSLRLDPSSVAGRDGAGARW